MMFEKLRNGLIAAVICSIGGVAFHLIHAPLPWMLGSLAAAAISSILGGRWFMPPAARGVARPVVGVLAGSAFSAEVLAAAIHWWDSILLVLAQGLVVTLLGYAFFRKAGFDRQTAFFASPPGGLGEMALLGASLGGNVRSIVVSHTLRVVVVLFAMPFVLQLIVGHPIGRVLPTSPTEAPPVAFDWAVLAVCAACGYGLGRLTAGFPAGLMIFPLIFSAIVHATGVTQAVPPPWLVAIVQIVIGGVVGARFSGIRWREMGHTVVFSGLWAFVMVAIAAATAYAGTMFIDRQFAALLLALAPGGMVEMTILTFSVGIEVAFVATCQIVRILFVLLLTPPMFNLLAPKKE